MSKASIIDGGDFVGQLILHEMWVLCLGGMMTFCLVETGSLTSLILSAVDKGMPDEICSDSTGEGQ